MPVREKKEGRLDYKTSSKEILIRKLHIKHIYESQGITPMLHSWLRAAREAGPLCKPG